MKTSTPANKAHVEEIEPHAIQDVELLREIARSAGEVPVAYRVTLGDRRVEFIWFYALGSVGLGTETTRFAGRGGVVWIQVPPFNRIAEARAALSEVVSRVLQANTDERLAVARTLEGTGEVRFAAPARARIPDVEAFAREWHRIGMPGEPSAEPDGTVSVAPESWDLRVFYHPLAAAQVLRDFPDAAEATESDQFRVGAALEESLTRPVARAEAVASRSEPQRQGSQVRRSATSSRHPFCAGGCGKTVQWGGLIKHLGDGATETYHVACFDRRESAPATAHKAPRTATGVQVRQVDENLWRATVFHRGAMYVCDYAPTDAKHGGDSETGAPTEALVREDWKHDRSAFRRVRR
jgi:hypothetical protein